MAGVGAHEGEVVARTQPLTDAVEGGLGEVHAHDAVAPRREQGVDQQG